jgi:glycosyltransferase involved in cell wall biosynthesis
MNILFVHQNFPAQYRHLAPYMSADSSNRVVAMHMRPKLAAQPGITAICSGVGFRNTPGIHRWLLDFESKVIRGEASWHSACKLREDGFVPDVICAHPGWGEALFLKDVWPEARLLCFLEFYYHARNQDVGFDPEFPTSPEDACRLRLKNISSLLALEACDSALSPTCYQRALHPAEFRDKISVIHDGIDTDAIMPNPDVIVTLSDSSVSLTCRDEVITFVSRNLEPYRGWHTFARALPELLAHRPKAHVLIVGGDDVSYGSRSADGVSYKHRYLAEIIDRIDMQRVHFLGKIPYSNFLAVLQISSAHIYLTYPFVLSWSMLEAMSAGALVIGSRTSPVEEVIQHGENGLLVDFFSPDELVAAVDEVLSHPDRMQAVRDRARQTIVERYDLKRVCLPQHLALINRLASTRVQK